MTHKVPTGRPWQPGVPPSLSTPPAAAGQEEFSRPEYLADCRHGAQKSYVYCANARAENSTFLRTVHNKHRFSAQLKSKPELATNRRRSSGLPAASENVSSSILDLRCATNICLLRKCMRRKVEFSAQGAADLGKANFPPARLLHQEGRASSSS